MDGDLQRAQARIGLWALNRRNRLGRILTVYDIDGWVVYRGVTLTGEDWTTLEPRLVHPDDSDRLRELAT